MQAITPEEWVHAKAWPSLALYPRVRHEFGHDVSGNGVNIVAGLEALKVRAARVSDGWLATRDSPVLRLPSWAGSSAATIS
jgi:hypothetical protein